MSNTYGNLFKFTIFGQSHAPSIGVTVEGLPSGMKIDMEKGTFTVYIKGISNLYERDCGELSGWIYMVNDKVPGYGCSQYILKDGDKIEFVYTCNLGKDVN